MQRNSGVLLHISSLPNPYGIGTMGKEAYAFIDFLKASGQTYWQILPLGPTSYGDSPYQSFSSFAGNPYFIDLDLLAKDGALLPEEYTSLSWGDYADAVDYSCMFQKRFSVLRKAWQRDKIKLCSKIDKFRTEQSFWIESYAMYMALKYENDQRSWQEWDLDLKKKRPDALISASLRLKKEMDFWVYLQYRFFEQWNALKSYANQNGIRIIGDIPIYVAEDSADAWANSDIFLLDEEKIPLQVAGCPPDYFSEKGQLWGNPLYNWDYLKQTGYEWWIKRMNAALSMYDVVRIDHFRAFSAFYSIPYGRQDAVIGKWVSGPGMELFDALKNALGKNLPIIAEDLGFLDDDVRILLKESGFPGMKVMQFGLTPGENSEYLPHNYPKNAVAYIGTHDNDTICGWFHSESPAVQEFSLSYMRTNTQNLHWGFIESLFASPANTVIVTMQDLLGLGSDARMNTPSTLGGNWIWRLTDMSWINEPLIKRLNALTKTFSR